MSLKEKSVLLAHKLSEELNSRGMDIWLAYGSSLGAIREGKIIDGDDDIDLMMWYEDFEKFKKTLCEGSLTIPFFFHYDFRGITPSSGAEPYMVCKITLGDKILPKGEAGHPDDPSFGVKHRCASCGVPISKGGLCQDCTEYGNQFHIDIYFLKKSSDKIRCYDVSGEETRPPAYKLYHYENLRKTKFENLDFYVSKYAEKTFDFLYNGVDGTNNTWRTPVPANAVEWNSMPSHSKKDKVVGYVEGVFDLFHVGHARILERSRKIFDKIVVGIHSDQTVEQYKKNKPIIPYEHRVEILKSCKYVDDVIEAPLLGINQDSLEFLNNNDLDYLIHGESEIEFLKLYFSSIMNEKRLFLLSQTEDYHTSDLINKILKKDG